MPQTDQMQQRQAGNPRNTATAMETVASWTWYLPPGSVAKDELLDHEAAATVFAGVDVVGDEIGARHLDGADHGSS